MGSAVLSTRWLLELVVGLLLVPVVLLLRLLRLVLLLNTCCCSQRCWLVVGLLLVPVLLLLLWRLRLLESTVLPAMWLLELVARLLLMLLEPVW